MGAIRIAALLLSVWAAACTADAGGMPGLDHPEVGEVEDPHGCPPDDGTVGAGPVYHVAPDGSDDHSCEAAQSPDTPKRTLNDAVTCLGPGATLYLREGTYEELLDRVIPPGEEGAPVTIASYPDEVATIRAPADNPVPLFVFGGERFPWADYGIPDEGYHDRYITLDSLVLDGNWAPAGTAIKNYGADHITIKNTELFHFGGHVVMGLNADDMLLQKLDLHDFGADDGYGPGHNATYMVGDNLVIEDSIIHGASVGATQTVGYGIGIWWAGANRHTGNITVRNNVVYDINGGAGIYCGSNIGATCDIYNNVVYNVYGLYGRGIVVTYNSVDTIVQNNTVYNTAGPCLLAQGPADAGGNAVGTVLRNNLCSQVGDAIQGSAPFVDSTNLFNVDARFVDAASGDFRLLPDSPAIDSGTAAPQVQTDPLGVPRPQGGGVDIGAFEYTESTPPSLPPCTR